MKEKQPISSNFKEIIRIKNAIFRVNAGFWMLVGSLLFPHSIHAQSYWNVATGRYTLAGNWTPSGVPDGTTQVIIDNGGTSSLISNSTGLANGIIIGDAMSGTLSLFSLSVLTNNGSVFVGNQIGSMGTLNVSGGALNNAGHLNVGVLGSGFMTISAGGSVTNDLGRIGVNQSGAGTVSVDGGTWSNSTLYVGLAGMGTVTVQNGGGVTSSGVSHIGNATGSDGTVTVTGSGSTFESTGNLYVADAGVGKLNVQNGATASNASGYVGSSAGSNGTITIDGVGSKWTNSNSLYVGDAGTGSVTIQNGALVESVISSLGNQAGGNGTATVTGSGSKLTTTNGIIVGAAGTGTLAILAGGEVSGATGIIGSTGSGSVTVDGAGSQWTNSGGLYVGAAGSGDLMIKNGGVVTSSADSFIANSAGSTGQVTVRGMDAALAINGNLTIGNSGTGTLTIQNGGTVTNAIGSIGAATGSNGTVTISGSGTTWINTEDLSVGINGVGNLEIRSGGLINVKGGTGTVYLGTSSGAGNLFIGSNSAAGTLNAAQVHGQGADAVINFFHTDTAYSFDPLITGSIRVEHDGGNTVLTAANTYTGGTQVSGGTLLVNNVTGSATGSGDVFVGPAGTLSGTGAIGGNTTVQGTLKPDAAVLGGDSLNFNSDLLLDSTSTTVMQLAGANPSQYDDIKVAGHLTMGGTLRVLFVNGFSPVQGNTFDLFDWGSQSGSFTLDLPSLSGGLAWDTSAITTTGSLSVVPEPSTWGLLILGIVSISLLRRRRFW